jgi:hypothetical protein
MKLAKGAEKNESVAYFSEETAKALGWDEPGFYVIEDDTSEKTDHVNSDGENYSVSHETNPKAVRRVYPAANGEGWVDEPEVIPETNGNGGEG